MRGERQRKQMLASVVRRDSRVPISHLPRLIRWVMPAALAMLGDLPGGRRVAKGAGKAHDARSDPRAAEPEAVRTGE
jgi:hypothetical protein